MRSGLGRRKMRNEQRPTRTAPLLLASAGLAVAVAVALVVYGAQGRYADSTEIPLEASDTGPPVPAGVHGTPGESRHAEAVAPAKRAPVRANCVVKVSDEEGIPIADAAICEEDALLGTTDASGMWVLPAVRSGPIDVEVTHPNYFSAHEVLSREAGETMVSLKRRHGLRVRTIGTDGRPVSGVTLSLEGVPSGLLDCTREEQTEPGSGIAVFTSLPAGDYFLSLTENGWVPRKLEVTATGPGAGDATGRPGVYRVPETAEVTVTVETPCIACVKIEGDEVVRNWWQLRLASTFLAPGVAASLRQVREDIERQNEGALVSVWLPPEPIDRVGLRVFLRHSGWRRFTVPVVHSLRDVAPYVLKVDASGPDQTGVIVLTAEEGLGIPVVAVQADKGNGEIRAELKPGEKTRVPLGRYAIGLSPALGRLSPYVELDREVVNLSMAGTMKAVNVRASVPIEKRDCLVLVQRDAASEPELLRGSVQVWHDDRIIASVVFSGRDEPRALWLPIGVPLTWRMKMLQGGHAREFECDSVLSVGASRVTRVVLR